MFASSVPSSGPTPRAVFDQFDSRVDIYSSNGGDSARLSSGYLCLKVLLMAANLVTLIFGIVLLAVASYALTSQVRTHNNTTLHTRTHQYSISTIHYPKAINALTASLILSAQLLLVGPLCVRSIV